MVGVVVGVGVVVEVVVEVVVVVVVVVGVVVEVEVGLGVEVGVGSPSMTCDKCGRRVVAPRVFEDTSHPKRMRFSVCGSCARDLEKFIDFREVPAKELHR